MAIQYSITHDNDLLEVKAWGRDDCLEDVIHYGLSIIKAAISSQCKLILCDERDLIYTLGQGSCDSTGKCKSDLRCSDRKFSLYFSIGSIFQM